MGPFAKALIKVKSDPPFGDEGLNCRWGLELQEKDDNGKCNAVQEFLLPTSLIIPTPSKARLDFSYINNTCQLIVQEYEKILNKVVNHNKINKRSFKIEGLLKFDIQLMEISKIRQSLIMLKYVREYEETSDDEHSESSSSFNGQKQKFLTGSYARYQWVASFTVNDKDAFKILFDATDIPQGEAISFIFMEDIKVSTGNKFQISIDVLNVGNLISSSWGVRQYATYTGLVQPISVAVNNGVLVYTFDQSQKATFFDDFNLTSRWQMQVGLRYIFK